MQLYKYPAKSEWPELIRRPVMETDSLEQSVKSILREVKENGDAALRKFTKQFDKADVPEPAVHADEFMAAQTALDPKLKAAILSARVNIETFHKTQITGPVVVETMPGVQCWRKSIAIEKVGLYIPGGTAPLFSTILMLGVPAKLAGCKEIIICTPPDANGKIADAILFAAKAVGITKVFRAGGVQAIGAMAYGTESIPKVSKIFGPGNQYVTCAKQLVQRDGLAIDMPAGPSEVAIFADASANAAFVAADLLSQAEHGSDSQVLLVSNGENIIGKVKSELDRQTALLPRKDIIKQCLQNSKMVIAGSIDEAIDLLNEYAPEHLIISCENAKAIAEKVINAGSVFIGHYSPESVGDYASGTNHTLPTNGFARMYSGVSVDSFVKKITFQELSPEGLKHISNTVILMAEAEGLQAHAEAVKIRLGIQSEEGRKTFDK
jgi:histidinol dehydrogenase